MHFAALLHQFRREEQAVQERAEAVIALCNEQGFLQWLTEEPILRIWALREQGEDEIAQMRHSLAARRAIGTELAQPYFLALLAEVYGKLEQVEEGLTVLADALATAHKSGKWMYEAELYRLKGELLRQKAKGKRQKAKTEDEAEACFRQAIETARRQGARSLELRAVMSWSRLWQQQGKKQEARQMLAEIYGWFTEGFDTVDLKAAQALLKELM